MYNKLIAIGGILGALAITACDLDVPDLNNPGIDDLREHPTAISIGVATTGLLIGNRTTHGSENGYVSQLGILGREAYCFDSADPRFVRELLEQVLNSGSPFGGNFWQFSYANVRLANIILAAVDKVEDLTPENKHAIIGFTKTIEALDLLRVIVTHDTNGAVVDTNHDVNEALPPIVDKDTTYSTIAKLLDDAVPELTMGGDAFPFLLDDGFSDFADPPSFIKFNRAIRARVAVYMKDYTHALAFINGSFINDGTAAAKPLNLEAGADYTYTTKGGDVTNGLATPNIFAHASVTADAQANDLRLGRKVIKAKQAGALRGLSADQTFTMYAKPTSSIPLIHNKELILLRAEVEWFTAAGTPDKQKAIDDLNIVRVNDGGLPKITAIPADDATFVTELLYERRYSLLFEGHRLIDLRRFDRTMELPLDKDTHKRNVRWPIPLTECNARPNEARCMLGST
jgi:starch-binding outer membrane protein, SusD/RagB family